MCDYIKGNGDHLINVFIVVCHVCGFINNHTQPVGRRGEDFAFHLFLPFTSDTSLLEKVEFPLDAKNTILFLLVLLCLSFTVYNTFGVGMEMSREVSWSDL